MLQPPTPGSPLPGPEAASTYLRVSFEVSLLNRLEVARLRL